VASPPLDFQPFHLQTAIFLFICEAVFYYLLLSTFARSLEIANSTLHFTAPHGVNPPFPHPLDSFLLFSISHFCQNRKKSLHL
jgi:hypothetical protein